MKLRHPFAALAAAALAVAALTGCQSNVGTAAHVDDESISASAVDDRLVSLSKDQLANAGQDASTITIIGRNLVTTWLVRKAIFERVWEQRGGLPAQEKIDKAHDRAVQLLFNSSSVPTGADGDAAVGTALTGTGVESDFAPTMIRAAALETVLLDDASATSEADLAPLVADAGISVRVNPRYGTWDAATLTLGATSLPSYVIDSSKSPAAPTAAS
ncbi:MAG: hypothetical protein JWN20_2022 [Jatrophihabitantaceae bacterium]|nr:hypothetical protein [Jatrophihabitantaceae bacterium]